MKYNYGLKNFTLGSAAMAAATSMIVSPAFSKVGTGVAVLEEIVVTARKRSENLQDIPIAVTALTAENLDSRGFSNISQIGDVTPNMQFDFTAPISGSSNAAAIFIRGVGQTDFLLTTDPGVGVYLDGVYIARSMGGVQDLMDVRRVEVLRGPQGTVFGKNTIGGAINITTKKPVDEFSGQGDITTGRFNRIDGRLSVNFPVADNLFVRLSGATRNRHGYGKRLLTGEGMGNVNRDTVRLALRWKASDSIEVNITGDYTTANEQSPVTSAICFDGNACGNAGSLTGLYNAFVAPGNDLTQYGFGRGVPFDKRFLTGNAFTSYGTGPSGSKLKIWGLSATALWEGEDITIKSLTAYRKMDTSFARDGDHSPINLVHSSNKIIHRQFSQEFDFSGNLLDGKLDWLAGLYYFRERGSNDIFVSILKDLTGRATAPLPIFLFGPQFPPFGAKGITYVNNNSAAAFAQMSYQLDDALSITAGLRYTHETKKVNILPVFFPLPPGVLVPILSETTGQNSFSNMSPRVSLDYKPHDNMMVYASFSKGFKSGGFTGRYVVPTPAPKPFSPESVSAYEVGFKADFLDKRLRLNGAAFYSDYKDIQVVIFNGVAPESHNVARGHIKGVEVELSARPSAPWFISAGLGYIEAKYTGINATEFAGFGIPITLNSMFVNTPEWSLNALAEYSIFLDQGSEIKLQGDWSYRSKLANDAVNTPELIQKGFSLFNARITYVAPDGKWEIAAFGTNLTDQIYIVSGAADKPSFASAEATYARPREWGINLKVKF